MGVYQLIVPPGMYKYSCYSIISLTLIVIIFIAILVNMHWSLCVLVTQSCLTFCSPTDCSLPGSLIHGIPGKNNGMGSHSLLQGIFPTQRSNPDLLHCRQILYCLSHQVSPRILEWVIYPFSRGSSWPRGRTWVSCIAGEFFTIWTIREALVCLK